MPNQSQCEGCLHFKIVDNCNVNVFSSAMEIASGFDYCRHRDIPLEYDDIQCEDFVPYQIEAEDSLKSDDDVLNRDTVSQGNTYVVRLFKGVVKTLFG